jgi:hypothetical protein
MMAPPFNHFWSFWTGAPKERQIRKIRNADIGRELTINWGYFYGGWYQSQFIDSSRGDVFSFIIYEQDGFPSGNRFFDIIHPASKPFQGWFRSSDPCYINDYLHLAQILLTLLLQLPSIFQVRLKSIPSAAIKMKFCLSLLLIAFLSISLHAQPRFQAGVGLNYKTPPVYLFKPSYKFGSPIPYDSEHNISGFGANIIADAIPLPDFPKLSFHADAEVRYDYLTDKYTNSNPQDPYRRKTYYGLIFNAHPMIFKRLGRSVKIGLGYSFFNIGKHFVYYYNAPQKALFVNYNFQAISLAVTYPVWKQRLWVNLRLWYTTGGYAIDGNRSGALILGLNVEYFFYRSRKQAEP